MARIFQRILSLSLVAAISLAVAAAGSIADLIDRLGSPEAAERSLAREELYTLGETAVPALIGATYSEDPNLRWEAVNLLGAIGDPRGIDAAFRLAVSDPDVHARWRADWALYILDDGSAVPRLLSALDDDDPTVVWNAAVALSLFGRAEAVPILYQGLEATGFRQWEVVNALGRVWDEGTVYRLAVVLAEGDEDVRKEAALSLGRIGGEEAISALLAALRTDPSPEVRWRAAMMLGRIGGPEIVPALRALAASEADPLVSDRIGEAIARITAGGG